MSIHEIFFPAGHGAENNMSSMVMKSAEKFMKNLNSRNGGKNSSLSKPNPQNDNMTDSRPTGFTESRITGLKKYPGRQQSNIGFSINAIGNLNPKSEESEHFSQYSEDVYNINEPQNITELKNSFTQTYWETKDKGVFCEIQLGYRKTKELVANNQIVLDKAMEEEFKKTLELFDIFVMTFNAVDPILLKKQMTKSMKLQDKHDGKPERDVRGFENEMRHLQDIRKTM